MTSADASVALLRNKLELPAPRQDYFCRPALVRRLTRGLTQRRLTVLRAPAGFGKTVLLADVARRRREQGVGVAWVTVGANDSVGDLGAYLVGALSAAGVDLPSGHAGPVGQSASRTAALLTHAMQEHAAPFLLAFDEVERLPRETVPLVDLLLRAHPPNLHIALAMRANPGFDLSGAILDGAAEVIQARDLRFSMPEVAQFFGGELSRGDLATVMERTDGWPVALQICRTMRSTEPGLIITGDELVTTNFLGVRLLGDLTEREIAPLLELSVFDDLDPELVDGVLGSGEARRRIVALSSLDGLLVAGEREGAAHRRLHPLIKNYCAEQLLLRNPERKRELHVAIAHAMSRRGDLLGALRHANETRDGRLLGDLLEREGAFRVWQREGPSRLFRADRYLTPAVIDAYPRLGLLHAAVLAFKAKFMEARALYTAVEHRTEGFTRDRDGGDDTGLVVDSLFTRTLLAGIRDTGVEESDLPRSPDPSRRLDVQCGWSTLKCVVHHQAAEFALSRRHGLEALSFFERRGFRYGEVFMSLYLGMAAMAHGQVQAAVGAYARARRVAKRHLGGDACLAGNCDVLLTELDVERNREKAFQQRPVTYPWPRGSWFDVDAASIAVEAELRFARGKAEGSLELLHEALARVRYAGIEGMERYLASLLCLYLVEAGQVDAAERAWRDHSLPSRAPELLDLCRQPWREMEALSCARIRLLTEQGALEAAADLADRVGGASAAAGWMRTRMRVLALAILVEERAGRRERAVERLEEYLRAVEQAPYYRPLVRVRGGVRGVVEDLPAMVNDPGILRTAESVALHVNPPVRDAAALSPREMMVLTALERGLRNKEIANSLGVSEDGVRYHLKKLYRKLQVAGRRDAVRRARETGLLHAAGAPAAGDSPPPAASAQRT